VRLAFTKNSGNLADPGSVAYQFSRKGVIVVSEGVAEDQVLEATIEHGLEDIAPTPDGFVLTCEASSLTEVRESLQKAAVDYESADVEFVSSLKINADKDTAEKIIKLVEALEDLDDVQDVYTNMDLSSEVLAQLS
jgi:transcriptional/translational regulatory protein YebC/TACO1